MESEAISTTTSGVPSILRLLTMSFRAADDVVLVLVTDGRTRPLSREDKRERRAVIRQANARI